MSQTFERMVDRKDAIIRSLAKDVEEAEEQYQVALRNHLQNMEDLIGVCVCVCVCVHVHGCVFVCMREREREITTFTIQLSKPSV